MNKRTKLSIITVICYALFVFGGAGIAIYMRYLLNNLQNGSSSGAGEAFVGLGIAIIMILAMLYAVVGVLPFVFKLVDIFKNKKLFAGLCIPFDIAYSVFNVMIFVSALNGAGTSLADDIGSLIFAVLLILISLAALITNIASLACPSYEL